MGMRLIPNVVRTAISIASSAPEVKEALRKSVYCIDCFDSYSLLDLAIFSGDAAIAEALVSMGAQRSHTYTKADFTLHSVDPLCLDSTSIGKLRAAAHAGVNFHTLPTWGNSIPPNSKEDSSIG